MKERQAFVVVTFHTTAEAMATEAFCKIRGIEGKLIPAPRALSSDCGIAWRSPVGLRPLLEVALSEEKVESAGVHELEL